MSSLAERYRRPDTGRFYFLPERPAESIRLCDLKIRKNSELDSLLASDLRADLQLAQILLDQTLRIPPVNEAFREEVERSRRKIDLVLKRKDITVFDCFRINPLTNFRILMVAACLGSVASLIVSRAYAIHLIHPLLALSGLVASLGFLGIVAFESRRASR